MSQPVFSFATSVSTNISICTILAPLPFPYGAAATGPTLKANAQQSCVVIDLASFYILAGSSGVGTVVTLQELNLSASVPGTPAWVTLTTGLATSTPLTITLANSAPYAGPLNGPFHGLQMTISGVVGNGIAYARISATMRDK